MLHHIALVDDWSAAVATGEYRVSTVGVTLEQEGFVHTAFAHQVAGVADRFYAAVRRPLVLLTIDEALLSSPWRIDQVPGAREGFPHVYGPVDVAAVVSVTPVHRDAQGHWHGLPGAPSPPGAG